MWQNVEARIEEHERRGHVPLRHSLLSVIKMSSLKPVHDTHYMMALEFGKGDRLLWELSSPAQNFFLHTKWRGRIEKAGFASELRPYQSGMKDGGRHSALSRDWSFKQADCIVIRVDSTVALERLLGVITDDRGELHLDPEAITRWIDRLRSFFPDFERFDRPDPKFDEQERNYKLEAATTLRASLENAKSDGDCLEAIRAALSKSNLVDWRVHVPISPTGNADREKLSPAFRALSHAALGSAKDHPAALASFAQAWMDAVPNSTLDSARQIAEFVFLHVNPIEGFYIRSQVRRDLWRESVGSAFPQLDSLAETYATELVFAQAVKRALEERGLAPRDMIDVQSALWIVHSYKDDAVGDELGSTFSRAAIEAAMDAFEEFQATGAHGEIFSAFGTPQDYWVRSTRHRQNAVFPTKPIIGYLLKRTTVNGGWAQKHDAASRLHNAGFIIVDGDANPTPPPPEYEHLVRGADRIRLCALNYYIEPAREDGAAEVSIAARAIASDLGLQNEFPTICDALGKRKFQELARVPPPKHTEPNPSSTTVFTYRLSEREEFETMAQETPADRASTTNLILYGPPGTGKTYATAWEAVKLCLGVRAASELERDRDALMQEYRRLVDEGRIEFVTFHQSFSYEDFVEGLRPTTETGDTDDESGPSPSSAGFSLKPHDGAFKRVSERARLDATGSGADRLDRSRAIFKITLGRRGEQEDRIREGLEQSLIHLGWGGDIDWSDPRYDDFNEILRTWQEKRDPAATGYDSNVGQTWSFRSSIQLGDYVILADGRDRFRAVGRVVGDYVYDEAAAFHPHRRKVEWVWQDEVGAERRSFYSNEFSRKAFYQLRPNLIDWDALERIVFGEDRSTPGASARDFVLIIDEINRANISKVFGELITLIEVDKRLGCPNEIRLTLPYSGIKFGVPANLHILGTMNTADRSIALLDTALRRRFTFRELMPDVSILPENVAGINLRRLLSILNDRIEYLFDREHQIGHAYFTNCRTRADIEEVMRFKIIPLLAEYFYEDWSKVAAVLGDGHGGPNARFLESTTLTPPNGLADDELGNEKLRWRVKDQFDFSEFNA